MVPFACTQKISSRAGGVLDQIEDGMGSASQKAFVSPAGMTSSRCPEKVSGTTWPEEARSIHA